MHRNSLNIAIIGLGMSGATCAQSLATAGHAVQGFDKSRGPGGRLATRRLDWIGADGESHCAKLDHGAVSIEARTAAFQTFVDQSLHAGWLGPWRPALAAHSLPLQTTRRYYLPLPDMPALCRHLLQGVAATWSFGVDALHKVPQGWQIQAGAVRPAQTFDAVVLALPPAQAAPLLASHRPDWARHAALTPMQPCWTLMGVAAAAADDPLEAAPWDLLRPEKGPLACVLRCDTRPGRARVAGQAHWVAHARAGWSRNNLERPSPWVQQQLQAALDEQLGGRVDWLHSVVHRWRYAMAQPHNDAPAAGCWWDAAHGLGVCGDFLGGGGVEGAWLSAQALSGSLQTGGQAADSTAYPGPDAAQARRAA